MSFRVSHKSIKIQKGAGIKIQPCFNPISSYEKFVIAKVLSWYAANLFIST